MYFHIFIISCHSASCLPGTCQSAACLSGTCQSAACLPGTCQSAACLPGTYHMINLDKYNFEILKLFFWIQKTFGYFFPKYNIGFRVFKENTELE
jgi:hypothetical protein